MAHQLRNRPIEVIVVRHDEDDSSDSEADFKSPLLVVETTSSSFAMLESEAKEEHLRDTLLNKTEIPIPVVKTLASYFEQTPPTWKNPTSYVQTRQWADVEAYDIDDDDEEWLKTVNREKQVITDEQFEELVIIADKHTDEFKHVPSEQELQSTLRSELVPALPTFYLYWKTKRERKGKSLVPKLEDPYNDIVAKTASAAQKRTSRKKKTDREKAYQKMLRMREELAQGLELLSLIKKREDTKLRLTKIAHIRITTALSNANMRYLLLNSEGRSSLKYKKSRATKSQTDKPTKKRARKDKEVVKTDRKKRQKTSLIKEESELMQGPARRGRPQSPQKPPQRQQPQKQATLKRERSVTLDFLQQEQKKPQKQKRLEHNILEKGLKIPEIPNTTPEPTPIVDVQAPSVPSPANPFKKVKKTRTGIQFKHVVEAYKDEEHELEDKFVWCSLLPGSHCNTIKTQESEKKERQPVALVLPMKGEDPFIGRQRVGRCGRVWWDIFHVDEDTSSLSMEVEADKNTPSLHITGISTQINTNADTTSANISTNFTNTAGTNTNNNINGEPERKNSTTNVNTRTRNTNNIDTSYWSMLSSWGIFQHKCK